MAITADQIRRGFEHTALPSHPTDVALPKDSAEWPEPMREQASLMLKPAGVLIPIVDRGGELSVLLTRRSAELKHHAGQVSFPGGRMEETDENIEATALRETHEEVGIAAHDVAVAGYLQTMPTRTGYAVTPVVGFIAPETEIIVDRREVEYTFEVPLAFFLDKDSVRETTLDFRGRQVPMREFQWQRERIWGATAYMIFEFNKVINKQ